MPLVMSSMERCFRWYVSTQSRGADALANYRAAAEDFFIFLQDASEYYETSVKLDGHCILGSTVNHVCGVFGDTCKC